jgi:hypothetical protein
MRIDRKHKVRGLMCLLGLVLIVASIPSHLDAPRCNVWRTGDLIFMNGNSFRSKLVRFLQGYSTDYSHVGLIVIDDGIPFIVNADPAEGRVVKVRWDAAVNPNDISGAAIFRVSHADPSCIGKACATAQAYALESISFDRDFDLRTSDRMFCTELVWRSYRSGGIDLCEGAESKHPYLFPADLLRSSKLQEVTRF